MSKRPASLIPASDHHEAHEAVSLHDAISLYLVGSLTQSRPPVAAMPY